MESLSTWKIIKIGFWLGIGFIIPSIAVYIFGTAAIYKVIPYIITTDTVEYETEAFTADNVTDYVSSHDKTSQVEIISYRDTSTTGQLLILGTMKNNADTPVSLVQVEAELFDSSGTMVYECSEYISSTIASGSNENFQIKCGCGKTPIPEYESFTIRITKASAY